AQPLRSEARADLLVGRRGEDQVSGRLETVSRERGDRYRFSRHLTFHVERAASPHLTAAQLAAERIRFPLSGIGEHDVCMREQQQARTSPLPGDSRNEVRAFGNT